MSFRRTALVALAALVLLPLAATTALAAPGGGCDQICFVGPTCCCGGVTTCPGEGGSCGGCGTGPSVEELEEQNEFLDALALAGGGGGCENTCDMGMACCCDGQFVGCSESCSGACGAGEVLEVGFDRVDRIRAASCASAAR